MIFCKSKRQAMLKANPNLSIAESGKALGLEWGKLSESAKGKYNKTAAGDRARYNTELEAYRSQHGQPPPTKNPKKAAKTPKKALSIAEELSRKKGLVVRRTPAHYRHRETEEGTQRRRHRETETDVCGVRTGGGYARCMNRLYGSACGAAG